jgi:hypothetical protein
MTTKVTHDNIDRIAQRLYHAIEDVCDSERGAHGRLNTNMIFAALDMALANFIVNRGCCTEHRLQFMEALRARLPVLVAQCDEQRVRRDAAAGVAPVKH